MAPILLAARKMRTFSYIERLVATAIISPLLIPRARNAFANILRSLRSLRRVKLSSFWLTTISFQCRKLDKLKSEEMLRGGTIGSFFCPLILSIDYPLFS